jgi:HPt (histidine-containing phosphotransfer) domain-containing protein
VGAVSIHLDLEAAIERMGDKEIFLEISRFFASGLPKTVQDMENALSSGDLEALTRLAHSCKSNCAAMGAEDVRARCLTLEQAGRAADKARATAALEDLKPVLLALKETLDGLS